MELTSPAFGSRQPIPDAHTYKGAGVSPPLAISNVPADTQSLAIIVHDLGAPNGDFTHWSMWNISGAATLLPEGRVPSGAHQGLNDFGNIGYGAPKPPSGTHQYIFDLYALNTQLPTRPGAPVAELQQAMEGHILATAQLVGTASA